MTAGQLAGLVLLVLSVIFSGVAVVHAKYESRNLFVQLQVLRAERDRADMDWGRLQLELATRGALGRVMRIADERLQMQAPRPEQIVVVR
ncbi:MAG: cell division protein FtsL [Chromatiaceae bacterium]